jgi:hypothetical protein
MTNSYTQAGDAIAIPELVPTRIGRFTTRTNPAFWVAVSLLACPSIALPDILAQAEYALSSQPACFKIDTDRSPSSYAVVSQTCGQSALIVGADGFEAATGTAWVTATYGHSGVYGSLDVETGSAFSGDSLLLGAATHVMDTLTVQGATKITMTYAVDGDVSYSTNPVGTRLSLNPFVAFDLTVNGQGYSQQQIVPPGPNTVLTDTIYSVTASITPGTPFTYDQYLAFLTNDSFVSSTYINATFDYSHTAQLMSTVLTDDAGNPVSGATLTSLSGFDYLNPQAPEPGTGVLGSISLLTGFLWHRRKKNTTSSIDPPPARDM